MANIKVAVRVRPISARELNLTGSEVVVRADSTGISLTNLKVSSSKAGDSRERVRRYDFDYCFDSSDQKAEDFADQSRIYQTLGNIVLDAVFSGYNSCLVAYGQSASGKTYTMMGTKEDPGLTPRLCEGLFERIEEERKNEKYYHVSVSYLEIYNERVRDLLKPSSSTSGLRVREHPRLGPYVQGLTQHVVRTLGSLMSYVEEGTKARKTASTLQNPSSSRSHALLTITIAAESPIVSNGVNSSSSSRRNDISPRGASKLRLVDLAGSESAATCSGVHRLKEGANINKSLVALGNVISALAERGSTGSGPGRRFIPYRDSSLTWLLKDALGGNATTIMLATISPASGSYNETAHTLRFAQRAQSVVNRPVVNEDPVARIIRELRAEVARLKLLLLEKNIPSNGRTLCCCQNNHSPDSITIEDESSVKKVTNPETLVRSTEQNQGETRFQEEQQLELSLEKQKESRSFLPIRRSNSTDSVTTCCDVTSSVKKFGSLDVLTNDRFTCSYNRARVIELNNEEDEVNEIHESVFVDIPTLVAVLIKPDDNLQETSAQIEEICSDEVVEESIDAEFVESVNDRETESIDHDERSSSVNSCHASGDIYQNEVEVYENLNRPRANTSIKSKEKPKFRKQDSVDLLSTSPSNLHTSKRFGSVETIQRKKDPIFSFERSHTNLEKRSPVPDKLKKLNNIREIDDRKNFNKNHWKGSVEQFERKGSNDSDKSLKESSYQSGIKGKNHARKPSLENLKRKTSKDSSSSSSKDEQILISSLTRDQLLHRKRSFEQESPSIRSHTPIQRVKRAEIVAAVTERLYSSRKQTEDAFGTRSPPDNCEVKSLAKMKLQEISRKMLGKRRRVCVDTQTDCSRTVRMKDSETLTETPKIIYQDVGVLTDNHQICEHIMDRRIPILRVKEIATLTDKPKTNIVRCKDVGSLANDLEEYDYEINSPRNDSGILSDDTQNYAESNLSSTEVSDLCQESDRRVAYAESSTNTSMFSPCRSFAVQTPRSEAFNRQLSDNKAPACLRQCCNSIQTPQNYPATRNSEKSIISISLPDTISITIESTSGVESKISLMNNDSQRQSSRRNIKDEESQTDQQEDFGREISCNKESNSRSTPSQTDTRVFRIENIFQDPNNASRCGKVDVDRTEGARIRNSITFRNSLGTSYVSEPNELEGTSTVSREVQGEGFIRDGLITEAFISRRRGFNSRRTPTSIVCEDSWRNWSVPSSFMNMNYSMDNIEGLGVVPTSWQTETKVNDHTFDNILLDSGSINGDVDNTTVLSNNADHDHGFSDDSLDYNENNASGESATMLKVKQAIEQRKNFCPPDVVAHTKKDCTKSAIETEKNEPVNDFEDNQVEFPKKSPADTTSTAKIHDYKSLILGRPCYSDYEEVNDDSDGSLKRVNSSGKKKVSFSSSNDSERKIDQSESCSKPTLKSIIKKRKKKILSNSLNTVHSSNDETDDSQQEEKASVISETDWKAEVQSTSSEEAREDRDLAESKGNLEENRKKVKFSMEELLENTCSESDSCENIEEDDEEVEQFDYGSRNILEEYLCEAVTFMRNLNSINECVNEASTSERYPRTLRRGQGHSRGVPRRRSNFSTWNRDGEEFTDEKVPPKDTSDSQIEIDDIIISTESYDRCMKGIQRLEDCIRRVDKHNELLKEKYGVDCESTGARSSLASPSLDPRVPATNNVFEVYHETDIPMEERSDIVEQSDDDNLEKKIFDQLMNVANSIRYGNTNTLQARLPKLTESTSRSSSSFAKFREKHSYTMKEPYSRDVRGNFNLEETSDTNNDQQQDFSTYEITGNLSVGRPRSFEEDNDELNSIMNDDFLPIRSFNRSPSRLTDTDRPYTRTIDQNDSRIGDNDSLFTRRYGKGNFSSVQRVSGDRFRETDDYTRRGRLCLCSKDQTDIESEIAYLRDKLKYPGSPRARFLELLRERRRIVECSRGTSAS
ncbi:Kinesin-like protein KIF16B [Anthophora quadrimaculata]